MNTYLKYTPPAMQFLAFLGLAAGFFIINYVLLSTLFSDVTLAVADKQAVISGATVVKFKWAQLVGTIVSLIMPALLFGYFSSPKPLSYVGFNKNLSAILILASIILLMAAQPLVGWLGELNSKINIGSMQQQLHEIEANYNRMLNSFLKMTSVSDLFINLFIMALLPAIGEELFFRGTFQRTLLRLSNQPWLAIFVSSIVFTMLHGTVFKFIPIFTLGVVLGTVYYVTRNLWYTITIHFVNNALGVLAVYYSSRVPFLKKLASDELSMQWYMAVVSLGLVVAIIAFMARRSNEVLPAHLTEEDNDYIA